MFLAGTSGPWTYGGNPATVLVLLHNQAAGMVQGLSGWTLAPDGAVHGLHTLIVPQEELPLGFSRGTLFLVSPENAFDAEVLDLVVDVQTRSQATSAILQAITAAHSSTDDMLTEALDRLLQLLVVAEYNVERTVTWDATGAFITAIDLAFVGNDAAADFANPDKKMRITYTRNAQGRVTRAVTREVAL
jgi:hypothetical protein